MKSVNFLDPGCQTDKFRAKGTGYGCLLALFFHLSPIRNYTQTVMVHSQQACVLICTQLILHLAKFTLPNKDFSI